MKKRFILAAFLFPLLAAAQESTGETKDLESGKLQLGMRSVLSAFSDNKYTGMGLGGQFRLKLGNRLNTEWFADYITSNVEDLAHRTDYHIGWAVQYYPFNNVIAKGKFTPYIEAGHCFDYTEVVQNTYSHLSLSRWSSAVHSGIGTCYNISDNFDVSLSAKYMLHMGKDIHTQVVKGPTDIPEVQMTKESATLEGHLLVTLSLNVYIGDLWGRK